MTVIGWWGAYPNANEATAGYLLQSGESNILLDCGSGVLALLQNYIELQHLDAVVISHYHWDHIADIGCLQYANRVLLDLEKRQKPLQIYGHTQDDHFSRLTYLTYTQAQEISATRKLEIGDFIFQFSQNVHPDPCLSMRIQKDNKVVVYITDTEWSDNLIAIARDADLLLCESSLYDEFLGMIPGHLTAGQAGAIAAAAGVKHLVLNHLPHYGDHRRLVAQAREKFNGQVELAATGKVWEP
ncbi:MAG: MBL fold metallo-hydrolase [Desulfobacterales bacterium]